MEKFYEAIAGYADLQRSSEIMQSSIENGTGLKRDQAQSALAANKKAMRSIKDFLDSCLASFPMRYRPTRNSHLKAQQVLSTPELLEAILFELPPFELLGAVRINRATFQIFKDSPRLLDRLQLRRRKGGHFSNSISDGFPGLPINTSNLGGMFSDYEYSRGEFENVGVEINVKRRADLAIGSRCRSMLVIRPHVTSMIVCLSCCFSPPTDLRDPFNLSFRDADSDDDVTVAPPTYPPPPPFPPSSQLLPPPPPPPLPFLPPSAPLLGASSAALAEPAEAETTAEALRAVEAPKAPHDTSHNESDRNAAVADTYKIVCKAGITVSHIVDAVQRLREAHRTCPNASIEEHGPDGIVKPSITFRARLTLKNDDPFLAQKDREDTFGQLRRISKYDNDSRKLTVPPPADQARLL